MFENDYLPAAEEYMAMYPEASEGMYPEIYQRIRPHADDVADRFAGGSLSDDALNTMAEEAVTTSGIMRDPPRGHNAHTVRDIGRVLILHRLFERERERRRHHRPFPPMRPPFFFHPVWGWYGNPELY